MIVMQTLRKFEINFAKYKIYYDIFMSILSVGYVISFVIQSKVDFSEPEASIFFKKFFASDQKNFLIMYHFDRCFSFYCQM